MLTRVKLFFWIAIVIVSIAVIVIARLRRTSCSSGYILLLNRSWCNAFKRNFGNFGYVQRLWRFLANHQAKCHTQRMESWCILWWRNKFGTKSSSFEQILYSRCMFLTFPSSLSMLPPSLQRTYWNVALLLLHASLACASSSSVVLPQHNWRTLLMRDTLRWGWLDLPGWVRVCIDFCTLLAFDFFVVDLWLSICPRMTKPLSLRLKGITCPSFSVRDCWNRWNSGKRDVFRWIALLVYQEQAHACSCAMQTSPTDFTAPSYHFWVCHVATTDPKARLFTDMSFAGDAAGWVDRPLPYHAFPPWWRVLQQTIRTERCVVTQHVGEVVDQKRDLGHRGDQRGEQ